MECITLTVEARGPGRYAKVLTQVDVTVYYYPESSNWAKYASAFSIHGWPEGYSILPTGALHRRLRKRFRQLVGLRLMYVEEAIIAGREFDFKRMVSNDS